MVFDVRLFHFGGTAGNPITHQVLDTTMNTTRALALACLLIPLGGCVVGNSAKVYRPTIGQELIDLNRAREEGAISEEEYTRCREDILREYPRN